MVRTRIVVAAVVLLAAGLGVAALLSGVGPAPGGGDSTDVDEFPTETTSDDTDAADTATDGGGATETTATPPFTFTIDRIEDCGTTCRDVTVTLHNERDASASDVTVYTQIYAGNSTAADDRIWEGTEAVGSMAADGSVTRTQRVSLSFGEAYRVQQADGWITVVTTVQSADETVTFTRHRDVA